MTMQSEVYVYFILNPDTKEIKIGQSRNPEKRLRSLMAEEGTELYLLGVLPDKLPLEVVLHQKFEHLNTRGEWFTAEGELSSFVRGLENQFVALAGIVPPHDPFLVSPPDFKKSDRILFGNNYLSKNPRASATEVVAAIVQYCHCAESTAWNDWKDIQDGADLD